MIKLRWYPCDDLTFPLSFTHFWHTHTLKRESESGREEVIINNSKKHAAQTSFNTQGSISPICLRTAFISAADPKRAKRHSSHQYVIGSVKAAQKNVGKIDPQASSAQSETKTLQTPFHQNYGTVFIVSHKKKCLWKKVKIFWPFHPFLARVI